MFDLVDRTGQCDEMNAIELDVSPPVQKQYVLSAERCNVLVLLQELYDCDDVYDSIPPPPPPPPYPAIRFHFVLNTQNLIHTAAFVVTPAVWHYSETPHPGSHTVKQQGMGRVKVNVTKQATKVLAPEAKERHLCRIKRATNRHEIEGECPDKSLESVPSRHYSPVVLSSLLHRCFASRCESLSGPIHLHLQQSLKANKSRLSACQSISCLRSPVRQGQASLFAESSTSFHPQAPSCKNHGTSQLFPAVHPINPCPPSG